MKADVPSNHPSIEKETTLSATTAQSAEAPSRLEGLLFDGAVEGNLVLKFAFFQPANVLLAKCRPVARRVGTSTLGFIWLETELN